MTTPQVAAASTQPRRGPRPWAVLYRALRRAWLWGRGAAGRHLSVRWKLTLWYGLMYALSLAVIGIVLPRILASQSDDLIRSSLRTTASRVVQLAQPGKLTPVSTQRCNLATHLIRDYCGQLQAALENASTRASAPGQFAQAELRDPINGSSPLLVPTSRTSGQSTIHLNFFDLMQAAASDRPLYKTFHLGNEAVLGYLTPLAPPPALKKELFSATHQNVNVVGVLEVYQPEHTYLEIQHALNLVLLLGLPLGLLFASIVGWWIARAALRPIRRISRTVYSIGESGDLSRRLNFEGPTDEVGRLAETFDHMMDRLEHVFETQRRFVADASHELRTPLTAIRGNADLLSIAPPEEREICVTSIRREAERMSRLVADLLLLAAEDIEEQPVHMQTVALDECLGDVYRSALVLAGDKLIVNLDVDESVTIQADPDRIKQLVLNLVDNAIKFTPAGGTVTIALRREPGGAQIRVSDTGIGIPAEERDAIFRAFYRIEQGRAKRGSGLGLAISAWIVAAHNGTIEVESEPGKGSTFVVHFPNIPKTGPDGSAPATTHQPDYSRS